DREEDRTPHGRPRGGSSVGGQSFCSDDSLPPGGGSQGSNDRIFRAGGNPPKTTPAEPGKTVRAMLGLDFLKKIFGSQNERTLKKLRPIVEQINALEPQVSALSDAELRAKTSAFKERLAKGETLEDILPEA